MINEPKILILYHSGAGSTKTLAEIFYEMLRGYSIDISSISTEYDYCKLLEYDFFILAFPTYHCEPSASMKEFIRNMPAFPQEKRAFVFTTCGLYSGNSVRVFIKECLKKNIIVCGNSAYRGPASDGSILLPSFWFMFDYEDNIVYKIKKDIEKIREIIKSNIHKVDCPAFKFYALLNFPNKVLGKAYKHNIRIMKEHCVICNKCVEICMRNCWKKGKGHPEHNLSNCEFCFKCIHHCPSNAIILSEKTMMKPKLNSKFYSTLKDRILQDFKKLEGSV